MPANMTFETAWDRIQGCLLPGTSLSTFTKHKRTNRSFEIQAVRPDAICVKGDRAKKEKWVPRREFEVVFPKWPAFRDAGVGRAELHKSIRHLTYIYSIFGWLESSS